MRGNATAPASNSDNVMLPPNSAEVTPASIAPGMIIISALSIISITVMESVSEANANPSAALKARFARSSGSNVSA